jgi:hypothetical protein
MSIERIFYRDWRECNTNVRTAATRPALWLTVTDGSGRCAQHFCSWDCILKRAAEIPPVEVVLSD